MKSYVRAGSRLPTSLVDFVHTHRRSQCGSWLNQGHFGGLGNQARARAIRGLHAYGRLIVWALTFRAFYGLKRSQARTVVDSALQSFCEVYIYI